jgi:RNA polymerase sigma-70 factor (ECF subfamily)
MDDEAFATFFEGYRPLLSRVATRLVGADEADDMVQDAYLRAYRHRERHLDMPGGWLYTIVRNRCLTTATRRREAVPLDRLLPRADPAPGPEEAALTRELGETLADALAAIPHAFAAALLLCLRDGLEYHEAAAVLGIPKPTVGTRVNRGRLALRPLLADRRE